MRVPLGGSTFDIDSLASGTPNPATPIRGDMRVIGTVGLPGSGKGEAAAVAREEGVAVVTMGDVIRRECRARGLEPAEHHGRVATELREEGGPAAVAERALPLLEDHLETNELVLVDGIRSDAEVERFERAFGDDFFLVSIDAPFEVRRERLAARDRTDDGGGETLEERDRRERGFGMEEAMGMADVAVDNTDTLAAFRDRIRTLLRDGPAALVDDERAEVRR